MKHVSKTIANHFNKVALQRYQLLHIKGGCCGNSDDPPPKISQQQPPSKG